MNRFRNLDRAIASLTAIAIAASMAGALTPQSGGASAFQGQDIMGGAAIVFKRPQRVRDIVGGAAALLVVKRAIKPAAETDRDCQ